MKLNDITLLPRKNPFRGIVDFYWRQQILTARRCPTARRQPNSIPQMAARQQLDIAWNHYRYMPTPLKLAWEQIPSLPDASWKDLMLQSIIKRSFQGTLAPEPVILSVEFLPLAPPDQPNLIITCDPAYPFDATKYIPVAKPSLRSPESPWWYPYKWHRRPDGSYCRRYRPRDRKNIDPYLKDYRWWEYLYRGEGHVPTTNPPPWFVSFIAPHPTGNNIATPPVPSF